MDIKITSMQFVRDHRRDAPTWLVMLFLKSGDVQEYIEATFNPFFEDSVVDDEKDFFWHLSSSWQNRLETSDVLLAMKKIKKILLERQDVIVESEQNIDVPPFRTINVKWQKDGIASVTFTVFDDLKRYKIDIHKNDGKWERSEILYFNTKLLIWETFRYLMPSITWEDEMYDRVVEHIKNDKKFKIRELFDPHDKIYLCRFYESKFPILR